MRALVILDHGSRRAEAHEHLEGLAERVRERAPDLLVRVAHLEASSPTLREALDACAAAGADAVDVHPLFLSPGLHLTRDIPERIEAERARHPELEIELTAALGSHEELADLILRSVGRSN